MIQIISNLLRGQIHVFAHIINSLLITSAIIPLLVHSGKIFNCNRDKSLSCRLFFVKVLFVDNVNYKTNYRILLNRLLMSILTIASLLTLSKEFVINFK